MLHSASPRGWRSSCLSVGRSSRDRVASPANGTESIRCTQWLSSARSFSLKPGASQESPMYSSVNDPPRFENRARYDPACPGWPKRSSSVRASLSPITSPRAGICTTGSSAVSGVDCAVAGSPPGSLAPGPRIARGSARVSPDRGAAWVRNGPMRSGPEKTATRPGAVVFPRSPRPTDPRPGGRPDN